MTVKKLRPIPPSGRTFKDAQEPPPALTPRCESTVQVVSDHDEQWRRNRFGDEHWNQCTRHSVVALNGAYLCRRHAGERLLEDYLEGKLIPAE